MNQAETHAAPATLFAHRHAAHCESGSVANLLSHYGRPLSEPMAFGLGGGLSFAYLNFIRIQEMPLIAYRAPPRGIIKGVSASLGIPFHVERFRSPNAGTARLDALLDQGRVVGLQTSVFWLPYFPEDMRFHFNAHNLVVYGREGDDYLISDPVFEHPVRCPRADLERARFAKGMLEPKGLLYYPQATTQGASAMQNGMIATPDNITRSIRRVARTMLAPIPIVGTRGMGSAHRAPRPQGRRHEPPGRTRRADAGRNRNGRRRLPLSLCRFFAGSRRKRPDATTRRVFRALARHR